MKVILQGQIKSNFTQEDADTRYLKLGGGTLTGPLEFNGENSDLSIKLGDPQNVGSYTTLMNRTTNNGAGLLISSDKILFGQDYSKVVGEASTEQTITLASGSWVSASGVYEQTITVTGITTDTPVIIVNPVLSTTDADANNTIIEAWGKISKLEISQGTNSLTFRATESLSVNIPLKVGVC